LRCAAFIKGVWNKQQRAFGAMYEYNSTVQKRTAVQYQISFKKESRPMLGAHKTGYNILSMIMASGSRG
jgi:hypothetical protein